MGPFKETTCIFPFHLKSKLVRNVTISNSWPAAQEQTWTYVTDRSGFLAVANLPLLWLFAGRNDIFLWLTGWSFGTFNIFHRYVARVVTAEAIIHSIGYTALILKCRFLNIILSPSSSRYVFSIYELIFRARRWKGIALLLL